MTTITEADVEEATLAWLVGPRLGRGAWARYRAEYLSRLACPAVIV